jgi:hypothetical protein
MSLIYLFKSDCLCKFIMDCAKVYNYKHQEEVKSKS